MLSLRARTVQVLLRPGARSVRSLPLDQRREWIERVAAWARLPRGTVVDSLRDPRGEWVRTPGSGDARVILYLHGGAFCMGSPASHRRLVAHLCIQARARAFSLDYRLAPEHPFPAALEDALAAYRHLRGIGISPSRIAFAGDSAGANILLAALIALRDAGEPLPAAGVCISPPTDFTRERERLEPRARIDPVIDLDTVLPLLRAYVGSAEPGNPRVSPIMADLRGLPPLLIQVGSREILYEDALRFADKAEAAGVKVRLEVGKDLWHVWQAAAPYVPEARTAVSRIGEFIRRHIPEETPTDRAPAGQATRQS